jgi:hypothetical protein
MSLTVTMTESGGFELHEENEFYEGTITSIEEAEDRGFGPGLKWIINLDGETDAISGEPRDTWAFCSQKLSPRSKLYKWARGVLGEAGMPAAGGTLDLTSIIGARVKVMFEQVPGTDENGNAVTRERVVAIKTSSTAAPVAATPAPAAPAAPQAAAQPEPF